MAFNSFIVVQGITVKLLCLCLRVCMDETVSGGKPPPGKGVDSLKADMALTFELVLHFVR